MSTQFLKMAFATATFAVSVFAAAIGAQETPAFRVDADFPGGNIIVERIDADRVQLHQDLRDTVGDWFYWCFRVRGAADKTLTFQFTRGDILTAMGPACSTDGGKTWTWLGRDCVKNFTTTAPATQTAGGKSASAKPIRGVSFTYAFPAGADDVRFCLSLPYLESNLKEFLARNASRPGLKVDTLCKTAKGRDVELLRLGKLEGVPDYRIAFTARHHACEMIADYVLEGIMESVLADDETGKWFREHTAILAVPFMDKDGVEEGDQGKNRRPHDHNRDYAGDSIYPTVAAVKKLLPEWSAGKLDIAIDLHCPTQTGNFIHFVGVPDPEVWKRAVRLSQILQDTQQGPLVFSTKDNVPYGTSWNVSTGNLMSFGRWTSTLPNIRIATTIETPYAIVKSTPVTPASARALGHDLATALRKFLDTGASGNR